MYSLVTGVVCHLHGARDALPVTEDLMEVLGAQDVPQGGLGQQPGVVVVVVRVVLVVVVMMVVLVTGVVMVVVGL